MALDGLSSTNKDVLWAGNSRAILGILLEANKPIKIFDWFDLDWGIGHYELGNDRNTKGARIHYKHLGGYFTLSPKSKLHLEIEHYVQWGGTSPQFGEFPEGFSDFIDVFLARKAGNESARESDQNNALGNHLGSYNITYERQLGDYALQLYHLHPFEDGSGSAFKNFPDGVWGAYLNLNKGFLNSILYEFVNTTNQSGTAAPSGNDNYFNNGFYRSGWTYKDRVIGLPFITPASIENGPGNNKIRAHHFGATASVKSFNALFKLSYVEGLGTNVSPFTTTSKSLYSYFTLDYKTNRFGNIGVLAGYDVLNLGDDRVGGGIQYSFAF